MRLCFIVLGFVFCSSFVFSADDGCNFIVDNSESITTALDTASSLSASLGGTVGTVVASVLSLISIGLAAFAKNQRGKFISEEEKRKLVQKALRATVEGIEAYKESKKSDGSESDFQDVERVNSILSTYQDNHGTDVRDEVRTVIAEVEKSSSLK